MSDRLVQSERRTAPLGKTVLKWSLRGLIAVLVVVGIARAAQRAQQDLAQQRLDIDGRLAELDGRLAALDAGTADQAASRDELLRRRAELERQRIEWDQVGWSTLAVAGVVYLIAGVPCWLFWHRTLQALGQNPTCQQSLRAYFIGHLGKYVPGKALVVVLRAGLVRSHRVEARLAVISVFVETLTMMAVGAAISAVLLAIDWQRAEGRAWLPWALGLMLVASVPTVPPIFRRIVARLQPQAGRAELAARLSGITTRLMLTGWWWMGLSWIGMGLSLWLTAAALPGDPRDWATRLEDLPMMIACCALAVVLGFASLIPGGFGVRELVVTSVLAPLPSMGVARALGAAVLLRLVWLVAEVVLSIILYVGIRGPKLAEPTAAAGSTKASPSSLPGATLLREAPEARGKQ